LFFILIEKRKNLELLCMECLPDLESDFSDGVKNSDD